MNRRDLIKGTGVVVMAGTLGAGRPQAAAGTEDRKNFLFVHGACHAATHWNEVTERLAGRGHRAFALDLPGSGLNAAYPQSYLRNDFTAFAAEPSPVAGIHLADYANAITAQLTKLARHGKVTLVGHSFGGLAITPAAEAKLDLIRRHREVGAGGTLVRRTSARDRGRNARRPHGPLLLTANHPLQGDARSAARSLPSTSHDRGRAKGCLRWIVTRRSPSTA